MVLIVTNLLQWDITEITAVYTRDRLNSPLAGGALFSVISKVLAAFSTNDISDIRGLQTETTSTFGETPTCVYSYCIINEAHQIIIENGNVLLST